MELRITVNGETRRVAPGTTVARLLAELGLDPARVAVERNLEVVRRDRYAATELQEGDRVEIVHFVGGGSGGWVEGPPDPAASGAADPDPLVIAGRVFRSRLMVGTGKYPSPEVMVEALARSGAEVVTVAVRRVNLGPGPSLLDHIDRDRYFLLPNTAGCYTIEDAVRVARLAREAGLSNWIKLEVIGDERTLLPDPVATIEAARRLVEEGFVVLPYTSDDHIVARRLVEVGCATVMPYGSPIGSGQGILDVRRLRRVKEAVPVPVIVDAGIGAPSDAALAMETGADAVLINTAIACAGDPPRMAEAFRLAVAAGRAGYRAGRIPRREEAAASSPVSGRIASVVAPAGSGVGAPGAAAGVAPGTTGSARGEGA